MKHRMFLVPHYL